MPRFVVAWVMLQRVPPDMRILTPARAFFSRRRTRRPASAALIAAISPAAPAPMTATSHSRGDEGSTGVFTSGHDPSEVDKQRFVRSKAPCGVFFAAQKQVVGVHRLSRV